MQAVQDEMETLHLYVVRKQPKKPYTVPPLLCAALCLLGIAAVTLYSAQHPYYEYKRLTVPAQFLPLKVFTAQAPIIPTGVRTYLATTAHGTLTITNGSVIAQTLPAGLMLLSNSGVSVATDTPVFIPAGSADGYGRATVGAHSVESGHGGNLSPYSINSVEGSSLYIRNLAAFQGGRDAYSVKFITSNDRNVALSKARTILISKSTGLHYPCIEDHFVNVRNMIVTWRCRFITYRIPSYMHVTGMKIQGKNLIVTVMFVARPVHIWVK